jgi:predicted RNase H-like nuclease (RuvC/YqgF family)
MASVLEQENNKLKDEATRLEQENVRLRREIDQAKASLFSDLRKSSTSTRNNQSIKALEECFAEREELNRVHLLVLHQSVALRAKVEKKRKGCDCQMDVGTTTSVTVQDVGDPTHYSILLNDGRSVERQTEDV